jgi:hypothetical protein
MARTSKSPKAVTLAALAVARRSLPEYAHRFSPKKFTQHQLFASLVLKNFLRTDYRGLAAHLKDSPSLLKALDMKQVPHFKGVWQLLGCSRSNVDRFSLHLIGQPSGTRTLPRH